MRRRLGLATNISFFSFQDIITSVTGILILVTLILMLYLNPQSLPFETRLPAESRLDSVLDELGRVSARNEALQALLTQADSAPDTERLETQIAELLALNTEGTNRLEGIEARKRQQSAAERAQELAFGLDERRERIAELRRQVAELRRTNEVAEADLASLQQRSVEMTNRAATNRPPSNRLWLIPDTDRSGKQPMLVTVSGAGVRCERFEEAGTRRESSMEPGGFAAYLGTLDARRDYLVFYVRPSGIATFRGLRAEGLAAGFEVGHDAVEENQELVFERPATP